MNNTMDYIANNWMQITAVLGIIYTIWKIRRMLLGIDPRTKDLYKTDSKAKS